MIHHAVFVSCHPVDAVFVEHLFSLCRRATHLPRLQVDPASDVEDADVTVVLVGPYSEHHRRVRGDIEATLGDGSARAGLLGILLPTYEVPKSAPRSELRPTDGAAARYFWPGNIPPALLDAVEGGFAKLYMWNDDPELVLGRIHEAAVRPLRAPTPPARPVPQPGAHTP